MTPRCRARGPRAARATTAGVRSCAVKWRGATNALCLKFKDKAGGIFLTGERDRCRGGEHLAYQSGLAGCVREGKKRLMANRLSVEWIEEAEHLAVGSTRRVLRT